VTLFGPEQADAMLAQSLHEYASFALFLAEPHLRRNGSGAGEAPAALVKRIGDLLAALASGQG
jgi:hypothetical protein